MSVPETIPELTALFERLGARNPESWASSQIRERIPQLHRYLFLRQCWQHVIGEDSTGWVDFHIKQAEQDAQGSFAGMGAALKRAVAAGVATEDLSQIARGVQVELLSQLCYMLEDNGLLEPELNGVGWGLFQTDEEGNPLEPIYSLHESVLDLDPTGREMRPKTAP
ncbi:hypothetical protein SAMN05216303_108290 [Rhodoferax sp. OV413]|uniref:hypothetical protein n=1 Tax=Rhodoferax sp. OV413 TaxID=1855285 RepID=UPI00087F3D4C|nr:hypothetical protein [Rhodoferax sp. OV413]SDP88825.1 hypothetical protein SAMN05216303_108290 [Rhodoferax sp. OV413]